MLAVVVIGFLYQRFVTDRVIDFVPLDAVFYLQARESFWLAGEIKISDSPAGKFFANQDLLQKSKQAAVVGLPVKNQLEHINIYLLHNVNDAFSAGISNISNARIFGKTVVVAGSPEGLEKITSVYENSFLSLKYQVNSKYSNKGLVNFYINSENARLMLNKNSDLLSKVFDQLATEDIYLTFNKTRSGWKFVLNNFETSRGKHHQLIKSLPKNFGIFINNLNLSELIVVWQSVDQDLRQSFGQTLETLETIYHFNNNSDIRDLLNQPTELMVFENLTNNFLNFDFVLALDDSSPAKLKSFEDLVKILLAQKLPEPVSYILPDGTKIIELLANVERWQWQSIQTPQGEIRYLTEPSLNFSISYLEQDGKIFIASSLDLLNSLYSENNYSLEALASFCGDNFSVPANLIFNSNFSKFKNFLPDGLILLNQGSSSKILGCILNL